MLLFLAIFSTPVFAGMSPNTLPALVPPYGELPPTFWEQHGSTVIMAGFAVLAFAFLFLKVMLRPEAPVILLPEVVARRALAGLQGRPEDGKLLSEVSQILRRHICAAFELSPAEMTTAEFSTALTVNEKIGVELARSISSFLGECDERKFSTASSAASLNAVTRALELVALAEKRRAPAKT